jgi:hypothetical protein
MNCEHCGERILPHEMDPTARITTIHRECAIRVVAGSAAHQGGECDRGISCADSAELTRREAAKLAAQVFDARDWSVN